MAIGLVKRLALGFASAGLAISISLTLAHLSNTPLPCGGGSGCEDVARDPSSQLFGIPVAIFGAAAYLTLIVGALMSIRGNRDGARGGLIVSCAGVLISALLTYHSITAIHATCMWCLGSFAMMIGASLCFWRMTKDPHMTDGRPPVLSAVPWVVVPIGAVAAIALMGNKTIEYKIDLSKVDYDALAATSHPLGDPKARITIVEFGDLMCPACRQMHPHLLSLRSKFPDKVSLLFHHFPMTTEPGHEDSEYAADLADRLDSTNFWKFVDTVYASQSKPDRAALEAIFGGCPGPRKSEPDAKTSVQKAIEAGKQVGVKLTPTYILFIDRKPDAWATSLNLAQVLSQPEFAAIIEPKSPKGNAPKN